MALEARAALQAERAEVRADLMGLVALLELRLGHDLDPVVVLVVVMEPQEERRAVLRGRQAQQAALVAMAIMPHLQLPILGEPPEQQAQRGRLVLKVQETQQAAPLLKVAAEDKAAVIQAAHLLVQAVLEALEPNGMQLTALAEEQAGQQLTLSLVCKPQERQVVYMVAAVRVALLGLQGLLAALALKASLL